MRGTLSTAASAVLGAVIFLAGGASAQTETAPPPQAENQQSQRQNRQRGGQRQNPLLRALGTLDLTADQKTKIDPITEKFQTDVRALQGMPPAERRTKLRDLTRKLMEDVNAVLTPEQQTKLRREITRSGGGPFGPVLRTLNLTTEQRARIDPIVKDANEQMEKLQDDKNLKAREWRDKMQTIIRDTVAKIRPNLTTEQQTKLDEAASRIGQRGGGQRGNGGNRRRPGNGNGANTGNP